MPRREKACEYPPKAVGLYTATCGFDEHGFLFLFQSGKNVQQSYHLMMNRILLYKEVSYEVGEIMRSMNRFIMQVDADSFPEVEQHLSGVQGLRQELDGLETIGGSELPLVNYRNIIDTFLAQVETMIGKIDDQDSNTMAGAYIEAENTERFIREGSGISRY